MRKNHSQQGVALVVALAVMAVIFLLVVGTFVTTQIEQWTTRNDATSTQAHYVAEAGLQRYKAALFQYYRWIEAQTSSAGNPNSTICYNQLTQGIDWTRTGNNVLTWGSSGTITVATNEDVTVNGKVIGNYDVSITKDPNNSFYTVRSVGHAADSSKATIQATFWIQNSGVLAHAIFAGTGQSTKFLNGNVTVLGGVYVVGEDGQTVVNANGNFDMENQYNLNDYYNTSGATLATFVNQNNRQASNLCATLRVQHGQVEAGGSATFGKPENKLLGVYVGGGAGDVIASTNFLQTCSDTKGICTQQGPSAFDIAPDVAPKFPQFDKAGDCGTTGETWGNCIDDSASSAGDGLLIDATCTSSNGTCVATSPLTTSASLTTDDKNKLASCLAKLNETPLVLGDQTIDCTYTANGKKAGFIYDGSDTTGPASFEVYGTVDLKGLDVVFNRDVRYVAQTDTSSTTSVQNASFVVSTSGTTSLGGSITTLHDVLPNTATGGEFPNHVLALLAQQDFNQETTSGAGNPTSVMAPVYAGNTYYSEKGNVLVGSVIANSYCTTSGGVCKDTAGSNSTVVYVNTGNNKPQIMRYVDQAGLPTFKVLSYENR